MSDYVPSATPANSYCFPHRITEPIIEFVFRKAKMREALTLQFSDKSVLCGSGPSVATIYPPTLSRFAALFIRADYNLGSFYTKGYWDCRPDELYDALHVLSSSHSSNFSKAFVFFSRLNLFRDLLVYGIFPSMVRNKIAHHYDTDPDFMRLMLGDGLVYTCAFFADDADKLETAQNRKIELVGERLALKPSDRVLELGCGWGTAAHTLSSKYGSQITALSISREQIKYANAKYGSSINFIESDYVYYKSETKYDKIYSIGMLEHIGKFKHVEFFSKISSLLKPNGTALVHSIVRDRPSATSAWIDKEIFPGAYIPSYSEILTAVERSGLIIENMYVHGPSNYYKTLKAWHENFLQNRAVARSILEEKMSRANMEAALRKWDFYLCSSRLCFDKVDGICKNIQITLRKR